VKEEDGDGQHPVIQLGDTSEEDLPIYFASDRYIFLLAGLDKHKVKKVLHS
jgi:hypothetical protein